MASSKPHVPDLTPQEMSKEYTRLLRDQRLLEVARKYCKGVDDPTSAPFEERRLTYLELRWIALDYKIEE